MEQTEQLNTFEGFLNTLVQDFGGIEIFSEENESRLNKVVKSQADSFLQEKKWMLIASMENIPQKLYSVMEFPQEAQQKMIDNSLDELSSLGLTPQVCENVISSFISVFNPCVGDRMAYVATLGDFNKVDLDGGKVSYSGDIPFGFACVRLVKNIK